MTEQDDRRTDDQEPDRRTEADREPAKEKEEPPETARRPVPGVEHEPEPSGENLIPAKNRPGTL